MQVNSKRFKAMTLIELLLVLSIMGTIAALTMPGLKKHSQKTENAKIAQQGYQVLEQSIDMAMVANDERFEDWTLDASIILDDKLSRFISYVKKCTDSATTSSECFKSYRGFKTDDVISPSVKTLILASGVSISGATATEGDNFATFYVDVNNLAEPNMEGVDVIKFAFGKFNKNCVTDTNSGVWKLCPIGKSVDLVNDGWIINYW